MASEDLLRAVISAACCILQFHCYSTGSWANLPMLLVSLPYFVGT